MKQFVCVRLIQANTLDLSLFQFDYDLTFAAFFLNGDRTVYGRFGTRSQQKADRDISLEGLAQALEGALELHKHYPANRAALAGKQPVPLPFKTALEFPSLKNKYLPTLDYDGQVARSCIHCHMIGEAERKGFRSAGKPVPEDVLFPWPMPNVLGLSLDPKEKARVEKIDDDSPAARSGLRKGDELIEVSGQPILSVADVQWILHRAGTEADMPLRVRRKGETLSLTLKLEKGWRARSDLSWRPTSWDLRRMATGGLVLKELGADRRRDLNLAPEALALLVTYVGQYNEHAAAKKAGFQKDDVVLEFDGHRERMSESDVFAYVLKKRMPGTAVPVTVLRGDQRLPLQLPIQ
jgi:serine protease Do